jgi:hypothetical protein
MRIGIAIGLIVGLGALSVALWWMFRSNPNEIDRPTVPTAPSAEVGTPQSLPMTPSVSPIVPQPFVEAAESSESQRVAVSRAVVPAGKARLEIPVFEADGRPATSRVFDLVTTMGVKTADELAQEEMWIAMTIGATASGTPRVKATYAESGPNTDGVATCDIPAEEPGHLRVREAPVGPKQGMSRAVKLEWLAVIPFEGVPSGETRRLQTVHLPLVPVLLAGRVETVDGRPVVGAVVRVGQTDAVINVRGIDSAGARSTADGTFRIESAVTASGLLAWAHVGKAIASSITAFEPGQTDVVLKLQSTGGLKGRIRVAPHLGKEQPSLDLQPVGPALSYSAFRGPWSPRPHLDLKKSGDLFRDGIPAGIYRLTIGVSITRLMTIEGIVIEPGKVNDDPRIADLVVGGELQAGLVRVVDSDGQPVTGATVYWRAGEDGGAIRGGNTSHTDENGDSTLWLPADAVMNIRVEAPGFRPWEGMRVTLPAVAKLDSGGIVTINLPGSRDWAKPPGVGEYLLCFLPETEVETARKDGKNPIPSKIHRSQCHSISPRSEVYKFRGTPTGSVVVFIIPRKLEAGRTVMAGEYAMLYGEEGLEVGRLTLTQGKAVDAVVYRVDPDKLIKLGLK